MFKELSRLFATPSRAKLLKFFLFQPGVRTTATQAAATAGIPKATAEKDARALAALGVLSRRLQKKKAAYVLNEKYSLVAALRAFLESTLPNDRTILSAFRTIPGISLIAVTGALALEERASVDMLIVAKKRAGPRIAQAISKIEHGAAVPIRYVVFEPGIFTERLEAHDRLLRDVFEFKNRVLLGKAPK